MPDPDELVPNCVTCRQHFEDYGQALVLQVRAEASPFGDVRQLVTQRMRTFHEEHQPYDN